MNGSRETRPEPDPAGAIALHRDMRDQALKVPWRELESACNRMAEWTSFALWVRAVVEAEQAVPEWLAAAIEKRCPAFLQSRQARDTHSLWLDLRHWVDFHYFGDAVQGGWIQALHYYSGRQPRAERTWQHWTRMDGEWGTRKPSAYPTFEQWQHATTQVPPSASMSASYVEWEAFALWARALIEAVHEIPSIVRNAFEERCPGFIVQVAALREKPCSDPAWLWDQLRNWIDGHVFVGSSIESLRAQAHRSLRSERIIDYWASSQERGVSPPPTFEHWLAEADAFVVR